jgi:P-type Ca2+ transporter type 2C
VPSQTEIGDRQPFHALATGEALRQMAVDPERGLSPDEVLRQRARHGENRLAPGGGAAPLAMLARQFTQLMIVVLLVAAAIAALIGEATDAIVILAIVVLNAIIGFVQEYRAERALQALRQLSAVSVQVLREGRPNRIDEAELVPGDIVLLEAGNMVPADLRVIDGANLTVDEAALTGESVPVVKDAAATLPADAAIGDRATMAHKGTLVTGGHGRAVTVATGAETELGRIAGLMRERKRPETPLQKRLASFGQRLFLVVLGICAVIFVAGLYRGEPPIDMLLVAVSLAVAAIPEALPAVVTIGLALGAKRMARRNALIRRLPAVESLGSVTVICSDKTGTLTENSMEVQSLITPAGTLARLPGPADAGPVWQALARAMALNSDAEADSDGVIHGDPTEVAVLEAASDGGATRRSVEAVHPRLGDIPFDPSRRRMATVHDGRDGRLVVVKGAPEAVLPLCCDQAGAAGPEPLDREALARTAEATAESGFRVLAFAEKTLTASPDGRSQNPPASLSAEETECDLTFLGFVALADPPRRGVKQAIAECRTAGIVPVMITGDHPATARAIASRLGILDDGDGVMTGAELAALSPEARADAVSATRVYARVSPEQKLDIVTALQARGHLVAMTGDGVNDAPALKQADIGVAMGLKGTDVAREAADAVLLDDDFATIVAAVREGRRIYDNIRKFIKYTMTSNSGEIWTILAAPFLGLPLPLLPVQILWVNLVTDGLPGLALGVEREEPDIMARPPRPPSESVFAHGAWQHMVWVGILIAALSLGAMAWAYQAGSQNWQTLVFTVLTLSQLVHAMAIRSERQSLFAIGWFSNPALTGAVLLTLALQMAVVYWPPLQAIFHTSGLTPTELIVALILPWVVLVAVEIEKALARRGVVYGE